MKDPHVIVGIDPGVTGAMAVFSGYDGVLVKVADLPLISDESRKAKRRLDVGLLVKLLHEVLLGTTSVDQIRVYLEYSQPMPGQGVSSMFNYGRTCGLIEGALAGVGITHVRKVVPAVWKRRLHLLSNFHPKDAGLVKARGLYPKFAAELKLKKHHNRAEAILIGRYGCLMEGAVA